MNSTEFTYWLQGFFEMTNAETLTEIQVAMIKDHLGLVFDKVTTTKLSDNFTLKKACENTNKHCGSESPSLCGIQPDRTH